MKSIKRIEVLSSAIVGMILFLFVANYISNDFREEGSLRAERSFSEDAKSALSIKSQVLGIRELEKDFMLTRDVEIATRLRAKIAETRSSIVEISGQENSLELVDFYPVFDQYSVHVSEAIELRNSLGLNHNAGLEGSLRSAAHAIEQDLRQVEDRQPLAVLMYMRRHEKDYMMRLEDRYLDQYSDKFVQLRAIILRLPVADHELQGMLSKLDLYSQYFNRWVEERRALFNNKQQLDRAFHTLITQMDQAASDSLENAGSMERRSSLAKIDADASLFFIGIFSFLFGLMLVRLALRQRALATRIKQIASLDTLTNLPNRRAFTENLGSQLGEVTRGGQALVVGIVDLNGFKSVNDVYGHGAGDEILIQAGQRLKGILKGDGFIARLGADEFGVMAFMPASDETVLEFGHALREMFSAAFELSDGVVRLTGAVGLVKVTSPGLPVDRLLEHAEYALDQAKEEREGEPVLFSGNHAQHIHYTRQMERILLDADLNEELDVVFQPIVEVRTGAVRGMEALVRWNSPLLGPVKPDQFISGAEETGRIRDITPIVLRKALAAAEEWPEGIFLSINLSALDVASPEAALNITNIILNSDFPKHRLVFEITETTLLNDVQRTTEVLNQFRTFGIEIALDDFGTGYSSLSYLQHVPIDKLKIDRTFISDIEENDVAQRIMKGVINLCDSIEISCVVEGVERAAQKDIVAGLGPLLAQGYYYSAPLKAFEVQRMFNIQEQGIELKAIA